MTSRSIDNTTPAVRRKRSDEAQKLSDVRSATLALLGELGYDKTSMIAIAKRTRMSKETLYKLFPSKEALFSDLIISNASEIRSGLEASLKHRPLSIEQNLQYCGEALLRLLTSPQAIAINRIAISCVGHDNHLAELLYRNGRETILPLFNQLLHQAAEQKQLSQPLPELAGETFLGLLLGDLHIRRLLGVSQPPDDLQIQQRTSRAVELFLRLFRS